MCGVSQKNAEMKMENEEEGENRIEYELRLDRAGSNSYSRVQFRKTRKNTHDQIELTSGC